ncbi:hypothetical protein ACFLU5_14515, partial [Bacteroidota bacterium]
MKFPYIIFSITILLFIGCKTSQKVGDQTKKSIPEKWELVWEENFDLDGYLDETKWNVIQRNTADWGNTLSNREECIIIKDGKAYLRGIVNDDLESDSSQFLTGGIDTKGKFAWQYGKVEIHAKLESARGAWPAMRIADCGMDGTRRSQSRR